MTTFDTCEICSREVQSLCIHIVLFVRWNTVLNVSTFTSAILKCDLWYCPVCSGSVLPWNHFDNDDDFKCAIMEGMLNCKFQLIDMRNKLFFPFEIDQGFETPLTEMDPDMHFYSNCHYFQNLNCDYYLEKIYQRNKRLVNNRNSFIPLFTLASKVCSNIMMNYDNFLKISWTWIFFYFSCAQRNMVGWKQTWLLSYPSSY